MCAKLQECEEMYFSPQKQYICAQAFKSIVGDILEPLTVDQQDTMEIWTELRRDGRVECRVYIRYVDDDGNDDFTPMWNVCKEYDGPDEVDSYYVTFEIAGNKLYACHPVCLTYCTF